MSCVVPTGMFVSALNQAGNVLILFLIAWVSTRTHCSPGLKCKMRQVQLRDGWFAEMMEANAWETGVLLLIGAVLQFAFKIEKTGETRWAELKRNRQPMGRQKMGAWKSEFLYMLKGLVIDEFVLCCFPMSCFHGHSACVSGRDCWVRTWLLTKCVWRWKLSIIKVSAKPVLISSFTWKCCLHFAFRVSGLSHKRLWDGLQERNTSLHIQIIDFVCNQELFGISSLLIPSW